jgi:ABC-type transport system substrate-binding protein
VRWSQCRICPRCFGRTESPPATDFGGGTNNRNTRHVRFKLNKPWPDFLTFYSSARGAGWIVPKKYVEKVGAAGFTKHPIGAGPYKFVSFTPEIKLVLEAFGGYWRKTPAVKRVVMKSIPDETTLARRLEARRVRHCLFDPPGAS